MVVSVWKLKAMNVYAVNVPVACLCSPVVRRLATEYRQVPAIVWICIRHVRLSFDAGVRAHFDNYENALTVNWRSI